MENKIVPVKNHNTAEILDIVRKLKAQGWIQGQDFDFAYRTSNFTVFTFYNQKCATMFILQYL